MEELILSQSILKLWWEALYAKCMTEELWGEKGKTKKTISIVWAKIPLQLMQTYYKKKKAQRLGHWMQSELITSPKNRLLFLKAFCLFVDVWLCLAPERLQWHIRTVLVAVKIHKKTRKCLIVI